MSGVAMEWAARQPVKGLTQLVLLRLAFHHNFETGRCDPSMATISEGAGISAEKVRRCMREIERAGLLQTETRKVGKMNTSNAYQLRLDKPSEQPGGVPSNRGEVLAIRGEGTLQQPGGVPSNRGANKEEEQGREQESEPRAQKSKNRKSKPPVEMLSLPENVDPQKWQDWLTMRQQQGKPASTLAANGAIKDLHDLIAAGQDPNKVIERATRRTWLSFNAHESTKAAPPVAPAVEYVDVDFDQWSGGSLVH